MPQAQAQAWWADVEEVKERIERRRAAEDMRRRQVAAGGRRTVNITGRPELKAVPRPLDDEQPPSVTVPGPRRRRPPPSISERIGTRPDRIAGWAVLLGLACVLVTILTAHA